MCVRLYSPDLHDGPAVLHSQGETLPSFARDFVFPQSAEGVVHTSASGSRGLSHPHPQHPLVPRGRNGLSPGTHDGCSLGSRSGWDLKSEGRQSGFLSRRWSQQSLQERRALAFPGVLSVTSGAALISISSLGSFLLPLQRVKVCVPITRAAPRTPPSLAHRHPWQSIAETEPRTKHLLATRWVLWSECLHPPQNPYSETLTPRVMV